MVKARLEWRSYLRPFRQPLKTSYGEWRDRTGILLKLTADDGQIGYGEIAPVPWFGSETLEQALAMCQQITAEITPITIHAIPDAFPACQFGFESAWNNLVSEPQIQEPLSMSGLLPAGETALTAWEPLWAAGYHTFKWKIATADINQELQWLLELRQTLPTGARLRLDANGGLTLKQAMEWLEICDRFAAENLVEYLEQPLPTSQLQEMLALQADYQTTIGLDESVATLSQLQRCWDMGWRSVLVIKPAIVGSPAKLRQFCQAHPIDAVFSSVFETAIGRQAGLLLAVELGNRDRAMGYGTTHWFASEMPDFYPWEG